MNQPLDPKHSRILIVDDQEANLLLIERMLRQDGYANLTTLSDPLEVVGHFQAHEVDLLILDLRMPHLDGYGIMAALRALDRDDYLPILVLTAQNDAESRLRALEAGAKDFVSKPFDRIELLTRIRNMLEVRGMYNTVRGQNRQLADAARQLAQVNRELESFSYSVAHDLRGPLRRIDGFGAMLAEDHGSELSDGALKLLGAMREQGRRMGELIEDLLALSRIGRQAMHRQPTRIDAIGGEIIAGLREAEPTRQVAFTAAPALEAWVDPGLMRIALSNLLGNAWKYTGKREQARIEMGLDGQADRKVFFVRDNGAGFDMRFAGKLFTPFQRLHGQAEFPGTGIGLATVQRIIHRHGGEIWAEAAPGQGASFYFTLPEPD